MTDCCESKACALDQLRSQQVTTLKTVLWINAGMFVVVLAAGLYASSSALLADSLDNLGDALTDALSLYAVGRGNRVKGMVSVFKGALILGAALFVAGQIGYKLIYPGVPLSRPWVPLELWHLQQTASASPCSGSIGMRT